MYLVLHAGVHATDEDRLIKCFLKNKEILKERRVAVPGPSRYRRLIRDTLHAMADAALAQDARSVLLDDIVEGDMPDRMILSNDNFFAVPKLAIGKGVFYPGAELKVARLARLFSEDRVELCLAIRNPATFLPAILAQSPETELDSLLNGSNPQDLRWSELLRRIKVAAPNVVVTVWCNEDTPLIWSQLIREMAGLADDTAIEGAFDLLSEIMPAAAIRRLQAYFTAHPVMNAAQQQRVIAAFVDKYALDDAIDIEVDLPGWTQNTLHHLTTQYEDDIARIQTMPDIALIAPYAN